MSAYSKVYNVHIVKVVDADVSIEDTCNLLLQEDIPCLVFHTLLDSTQTGQPYLRFIDFALTPILIRLPLSLQTLLINASCISLLGVFAKGIVMCTVIAECADFDERHLLLSKRPASALLPSPPLPTAPTGDGKASEAGNSDSEDTKALSLKWKILHGDDTVHSISCDIATVWEVSVPDILLNNGPLWLTYACDKFDDVV
ncbi:uncharacterized protein HD556DRAFT_1308294 [Suillus plorans]|uniref:Uncharacterized protein n=1 Tax=Suillus plorans TaxID=116603 RepID=A0A9P7ARM6_9AGAM|nr:uncharacterized protein HD556DRAFT_1308294 [Suillus plorans]KAG1794246.1 hypothetical protein HD556DRAFT_1308294 [Suillus plorans]